MSALYVLNSSPLIVFERVERSELLHTLLANATIPPAVRREVFGSNPLPEWIQERSLTQPLASQIIRARLGLGEREAIALAFELHDGILVVDDLHARRLAQSLEIPVIGSLGLLLRAKERGFLPAIRPIMDAMQSDDFRIAEKLFAEIMRAAGED